MCSHLIKELPSIFDELNKSMLAQNATLFRSNGRQDDWSPREAQSLCKRLEHEVKSQDFGFPHLKHVFFFDGHQDITTDDYANLFLVPSEESSKSSALTRCSNDTCELRSACPSLSSLTIGMWYKHLQLSASFFRAMAHLAQHHPNLVTLRLFSHEICFDHDKRETDQAWIRPSERRKDESFSREVWYDEVLTPVLRLAQELLPRTLTTTIYLLTDMPREERGYIEPRQHLFPDIIVEPLPAASFQMLWESSCLTHNVTRVQQFAADIFRTMCRDDESLQKDDPHFVEFIKKSNPKVLWPSYS